MLAAIAPGAAGAHGGAASPGSLWSAWNLDPAVVIPIVLAAWIYARGLRRLWRHAGAGRAISRRRALAYAAGIAALAGALLSPLDAAADVLFSVHMIQHLTLIFVAAPLLILGAPDVAFLWALPARWRPGGGRIGVRLGRSLGGGVEVGPAPLIVVLIATGVLWMWHLPLLYDLAVRNAALHWAEHASFLVTALMFWASVLRLRPRDHSGNGLRILYASGMALQGSILGALITFAGRPLYADFKRSIRKGAASQHRPARLNG